MGRHINYPTLNGGEKVSYSSASKRGVLKKSLYLSQNSDNEESSRNIGALACGGTAGGLSLWSAVGRRLLPRAYICGICRGSNLWPKYNARL